MAQRSQQEYFDELVQRTANYRSSAEYLETLRVVAALKDFSPFNAYLLRIQRPTLRFATSLEKWERRFERSLRVDRPTYPLVILKPFGPVDFVYDFEDTEGRPLPLEVMEPYRASGYVSSQAWELVMRNARRRGVLVDFKDDGSEAAASIGSFSVADDEPDKKATREKPPVRFAVRLNGQSLHISREAQFTSLLHELGHLCCGHLGALPSDDWPQRHKLPLKAEEFEAESVAFIVCKRLGLECNSEEYLAGYVERGENVPREVSIHTVLKAAGLIEEWASKLTFPRKPRREQAERQLRSRQQDVPAGGQP